MPVSTNRISKARATRNWAHRPVCRQHYLEVGLGADYVDQFVR